MGGSGGGSGGGGGGSGQINYPAYMEAFHTQALSHGGTDTPTSSMTDLLNTALASNPFTGESAYDPTDNVGYMELAVASFDSAVDALDHETNWVSAMEAAITEIDGSLIDDTTIENDVQAFSDNMDDIRDNNILPRFKAGMLNINAVMTSSFVIGEAVIEAFGARDVAKYEAELRAKLMMQRNELVVRAADRMLADLISRVDFERAVAHYNIEANRVAIVAYKEQIDRDLQIDEMEAKYPFEVYAYVGNMLAAPGGGVGRTGAQSENSSKSTIGGALSGAAAGAYVGTQISPGYGTAIGAVVGAIGGAFASS